MPKGSRLKQYRPYGVINVVSRADCLESFICQKPALASSLENIVDPPICARICSTNGKMCLSLCTLAFNFVKSTQMRILPLGLGTTTIPTHQSVGLSTLVIIPMFSIRVSSCFTLGNNGRATLHGVVSAYGFASCLS